MCTNWSIPAWPCKCEREEHEITDKTFLPSTSSSILHSKNRCLIQRPMPCKWWTKMTLKYQARSRWIWSTQLLCRFNQGGRLEFRSESPLESRWSLPILESSEEGSFTLILETFPWSLSMRPRCVAHASWERKNHGRNCLLQCRRRHWLCTTKFSPGEWEKRRSSTLHFVLPW